jgi:hypothetical protein
MNNRNFAYVLLLPGLLLGLAPFLPEPHIWGKLKWVLGGAVGMQPMDWFDLALHGAPLAFSLVFLMKRIFKSRAA